MNHESAQLTKSSLLEQVKLLREVHGQLEPPFDPLKVNRVGKARIEFAFLPPRAVGAPGSIEPAEYGFVIKLDQNLRRVNPAREFRLRSRAAHELMHALFYDTSVLPPLRAWKGTQTRSSYLKEEELCNHLAREFLVPAAVLRSKISSRPTLGTPSLANLSRLKDEFEVSSDILSYRLIRDVEVWKALFAKYLRAGSIFKVATRIKFKTSTLFRKLKIPSYIGQQTGALEGLFRQGASVASTGRNWETTAPLLGHEVRLESVRDSVDPLAIVFLVSDACHGSAPLNGILQESTVNSGGNEFKQTKITENL